MHRMPSPKSAGAAARVGTSIAGAIASRTGASIVLIDIGDRRVSTGITTIIIGGAITGGIITSTDIATITVGIVCDRPAIIRLVYRGGLFLRTGQSRT